MKAEAGAVVLAVALVAWLSLLTVNAVETRPRFSVTPTLTTLIAHNAVRCRGELRAAIKRIEVLEQDVDVAHFRVTHLHAALDAVSKTQPGRDRTPYVPKLCRPKRVR